MQAVRTTSAYDSPCRGDVLFRSDKALSLLDARVGYYQTDFPFREGHRRGARRLAEHVCENVRDQDLLVYPIVFLYRHHVELALKRLIELAADLAEEELDHKTSIDIAKL